MINKNSSKGRERRHWWRSLNFPFYVSHRELVGKRVWKGGGVVGKEMTIELPLRPLHLPSCQNCGAPTAAPEQCNTILATIALTRSTIALTSDQCTGTGGCAVCWGSEWIAGCVTLLTGRRSSEGPSCPPLPPIHSALCSAHAWLHFLAHNVAHFCTAQVHFTTRVDNQVEYQVFNCTGKYASK